MAVVLDSLNATLTRTVFVKPPDLVRQFTPLPRAIVNFNILNGVISAKPVNDQQELIIGVTLDGDFAYRMVDFTCSLLQDVANDWNPRGYLELTNALRNLQLGATQRHVLVLEDAIEIPTPVEMWIATERAGLPRYVIQTPSAFPSASPVITFKATNQSAAVGVAGTVNFFMTFLEYDIEQAEYFALHYPTMVLER